MSLWQKLLRRHAAESIHVGPEPVKYFEVAIPKSPQYLCSDRSCPCPGTEQLVPGKTGFVYISEETVQLRANAPLTHKAFMKAQEDSAKARGVAMVFFAQGTYEPLFMCEQAARQRGLDLTVAAADAAYLFKHGWCPLRPTPKQRIIVTPQEDRHG
jgi:hypothetical protein